MALKGLVSSDWHLLGMAKVLGTKACEWQFREINKIYEHATQHSIEHIFVPGDISDVARLDEENFIALVSHLLTWDSSIKTYYIRGNHDRESRFRSSLDVLEVLCNGGIFKNFKLYSTAETVSIDGVNVSFLPFPETNVPEAKDKKPRLIFAHLETAGAIGDNGRPLKHGNDDKVNRTSKDYVISGHIHQYQEIKSKRFLYNGNPFQKNFGEQLPKGFIEIDAFYKDKGSRLVVNHTFINSKPNFTLVNLLINSQKDWSKLKKDPSIRYKLWIDRNEGILVPKDLTREYPNVISLNGIDGSKSKTSQDVLEVATKGITIQDLPKFNPLTGLKKFVLKEGLDKRSAKKARDYVLDALNTLR